MAATRATQTSTRTIVNFMLVISWVGNGKSASFRLSAKIQKIYCKKKKKKKKKKAVVELLETNLLAKSGAVGGVDLNVNLGLQLDRAEAAGKDVNNGKKKLQR